MKKLLCLILGHNFRRDSFIGGFNSKRQKWKCIRCDRIELWEEIEIKTYRTIK